ncbi:glycolipid 2-alpha-mannosyltransferase-like [Lingula anatina]|uniref:Glycolipid 2-alpha-mannosyltransferase-like n=1 Tax=Lingula anatina TaxID=7574 RepID=A0A1S3HMH0_LINAN|nr:glycolipid 2-alpha-mannosyltransferase-like [Lingula anatina]|eukprot:XP_013386701.1 glycolipid 2-alpha-mannosyltransferase-like [Lingula anatina]
MLNTLLLRRSRSRSFLLITALVICILTVTLIVRTQMRQKSVLRDFRNDQQLKEFQRVVSTWPNGKPKAVIYFLTYEASFWRMKVAVRHLDTYFNQNFQYPVVVFYEGNVTDRDLTDLTDISTSRIFFQKIHFNQPYYLNVSVEEAVKDITCPKPDRSRFPGYNHMSRFHARLVAQQPILANITWYFRLDDDSLLQDYITYDIFRFMQDNHYTYGYNLVFFDNPLCLTYLKENITHYLKVNSIEPKEYSDWPDGGIFYNNFEVSRFDFWRRPDVVRFLKFIDESGGIYHYRWGDAPIKSAAVLIFLPRQQLYHFRKIKYYHGPWYPGFGETITLFEAIKWISVGSLSTCLVLVILLCCYLYLRIRNKIIS